MKDLKSIGTTLFLISLLIFTPQAVKSQDNKTVNITSSGNGVTQKEATQVALRSAIEQTFGVFISSKTDIFNNQIVADEIASVANGNIQSYNILNQSQLPDGSWSVTLNAVISISKLTSFVQSKGVSVEIQGGLFAINIKQQLLNEQAETKAIQNMVEILHEQMQLSFDYKIEVGEPVSANFDNTKWRISIKVIATANKNMDFCSDYFTKTLKAVGMTSQETANYSALKKHTFEVIGAGTFYLRSLESITVLKSFRSFFKSYPLLFKVNVNNTKGSGGYWFGISCEQLTKSHSPDDNTVRENPTNVNFNFLRSGQCSNEYGLTDVLTLTEVEQLKGYDVQPLGVYIKLKEGGIVINENNDGSGLVIPLDMTSFDGYDFYDKYVHRWEDAKQACKDLKLNGYNDWRMPSSDELKLFQNFPYKPYMINGYDKFYWADEECSNGHGAISIRKHGQDYDVHCDGKNSLNLYIPVRSYTNFSRSHTIQASTASNNNSSKATDINYGSVKDIDGNVYKTVTIGTQTWMAENLKTTKYNDGTDIPLVYNNAAWSALNSGASCSGTSDKLYNWYAVNTGKLAPIGWHIPTFEEWKTLALYLIANGYNYDGSKTDNLIAKSLASQTGWAYLSSTEGNIGNNVTENNKSGFSALPSGWRDYDGNFKGYGAYGYWWTATETESNFAASVNLEFRKNNMGTSSSNKLLGFSIRCVKDKK